MKSYTLCSSNGKIIAPTWLFICSDRGSSFDTMELGHFFLQQQFASKVILAPSMTHSSQDEMSQRPIRTYRALDAAESCFLRRRVRSYTYTLLNQTDPRLSSRRFFQQKFLRRIKKRFGIKFSPMHIASNPRPNVASYRFDSIKIEAVLLLGSSCELHVTRGGKPIQHTMKDGQLLILRGALLTTLRIAPFTRASHPPVDKPVVFLLQKKIKSR